MIQSKELFWRMTKISERYLELKTIFDNFYQLSADRLTDEKSPFKSIIFLPQLEKNFFDVSFAGKETRFSFVVAGDEKAILLGFVKCSPIGPDEKPLDTVIGEFSFNRQAETSVKDPDNDGDPLCIDVPWGAGYIVLNLLYDSFARSD